MTEHNGTCVVCKKEGVTVRTFICEDCMNPDGATLVCRVCGRHLPISQLGLQHIRQVAEIDLPAGPGVVLVSSWLPGCSHPEPETTDKDVEIYTVSSFMN